MKKWTRWEIHTLHNGRDEQGKSLTHSLLIHPLRCARNAKHFCASSVKKCFEPRTSAFHVAKMQGRHSSTELQAHLMIMKNEKEV